MSATKVADRMDPRPWGCGYCDGGWVSVTTKYVERKVATMTPEDPLLEGKRAAAANTVYPCKHCRPKAFQQWLDLTHQTTGRDDEPTANEDPGPAPPSTWDGRKDLDW